MGAGVVISVSFGALLLVSLTEMGKFKSIILLAPLYSKTKKKALLDNFMRGQIFRFIVEHPGVHFNRIKQELGLNNGALTFHLKKLEEEVFIVSRNDGFRKRFFPSEGSVPSLPTKYEQILSAIRLNPGITQKEIAKELDTPPSTVNVNIRKMREAQIIKNVKKGKALKCYLVEDEKD
jgi:predicted transcriptional regulator